MTTFSKPIQTMFVGKDIKHSIKDGKYMVYKRQKWILEKAMKKDGILILTLIGKPLYKIRVIKYWELDTKQITELEFKKFLDNLYKYYPPNKSMSRNWDIYFEFELLETY